MKQKTIEEAAKDTTNKYINEREKQTAVEWLEQEFEKRLPLGVGDVLIDLIKQAKELEKQQIMDANIAGMEFIPVDPNRHQEDAKQYYNETFNNKP